MTKFIGLLITGVSLSVSSASTENQKTSDFDRTTVPTKYNLFNVHTTPNIPPTTMPESVNNDEKTQNYFQVMKTLIDRRVKLPMNLYYYHECV